jgi:competence protein CoiA
MKFALVNGEAHEAQPGLSGECPACAHPMVAKCGEVRIRHWAHRGGRWCDPWWEPESEWHRNWKNQFPDAWQEVIHVAPNGTKHIADVKTEHGWVIEFQHSHLEHEERRSRDAFYRQLVWVVDATRRKTDAARFSKAWDASVAVAPAVQRLFVEDCALLREWSGSSAPIFLDFGGPKLCWLLPNGRNASAYVTLFPRDQFIFLLRGGVAHGGTTFGALVKELGERRW